MATVRKQKITVPYKLWEFLLSFNTFVTRTQKRRDLAKRAFYKMLDNRLRPIRLETARFDYVLYPRTIWTDRNNVLSIIDKFFMDYLVDRWYIRDDWNRYNTKTTFATWPVNYDDPHVTITIKANKIPFSSKKLAWNP